MTHMSHSKLNKLICAKLLKRLSLIISINKHSLEMTTTLYLLRQVFSMIVQQANIVYIGTNTCCNAGP